MRAVAGLSVEAVLDGLDDGVLLNCPDGRVLYANPALAAMLGYDVDALVGKTLFDLVHPESAPAVRDRLRRRREGVRERFDFRLQRADGSPVEVLVAARPAYGADGVHVGSLVAITDITEHVAMAADLREMRDQLEARVAARTAELEQANRRLEIEVLERMAAEDAARWASAQKSRFLANISHELRTPLNAIIGYTELVLDEPEAPVARAAADLGHVLSSARHLLELINGILDLSMVEAGRVQLRLADVDLATIAEEACALLRPSIEAHGNRLRLTVLADRCPARTDPMRVKQILFNLLHNADRYTLQGEVSVEVDPNGPAIRVRDTGVGIAPADHERIFEAFVQVGTPGLSHGTGLGLALCRQYARRLGGDVTVESAPGRGSCFTFVLGRPIDAPPDDPRP